MGLNYLYFFAGVLVGLALMFVFRGGKFSITKTLKPEKEVIEVRCEKHGWITLNDYYNDKELQKALKLAREDRYVVCPVCRMEDKKE